MRKDFGTVKTDLIGQVFGNLRVIERAPNRFKPNGKSRTMWKCECSYDGPNCKKFCEIDTYSLTTRGTVSCGCFNRERVIKAHITHGLTQNPLMKRFIMIIDRCTNPNNATYKDYGGRGIKVYDEWLDPVSGPGKFVQYIESICPNVYELLEKGCQIDRKENSLGYQPGNLRVVDRMTNMNNTRVVSKYKIFDSWLSPKEAMRKYRKDMKWSTLKYRLATGWDIERAIIVPMINGKDRPSNFNVPPSKQEITTFLASIVD